MFPEVAGPEGEVGEGIATSLLPSLNTTLRKYVRLYVQHFICRNMYTFMYTYAPLEPDTEVRSPNLTELKVGSFHVVVLQKSNK